jgi:G3E family GTPase
LTQQIRIWNPSAPLVEAVQGQFAGLGNQLKTLFDTADSPNRLNQLPLNQRSAARPDIGSCVIRTQKIISEKKFLEFCETHKSKIIRMKGFLRTSTSEICSVQTIFDQVKIIPVDFWKGSTEIIFMGPGVEPRWILKELTS